jgi:hypothetical protein
MQLFSRQMSRHILIRTGLIFIFALLISGCSIKIVYNQLDWLVPWYVDDYVSLTDEQEVIFNNHLDEYLRWHRTQQLPVYADFLDWAASASENGFDDIELQYVQQQMNQFTATMFTQLAPALVDLFQSFSDEQVDELFVSFTRENLDYREEKIEISEHEHREDRAEELTRLVERWTGELDEQQLQHVEQWSLQYKRMSTDFLVSREKWQQELKIILQRRDERDYLQTALLDLFARRYTRRTAYYQEKFQFNEQLLKSLYAALDRSLSPRQRQSMVSEFTDVADDFRQLAEQG